MHYSIETSTSKYASRSTAEHMRSHHEYRRDDGVLFHPSNGEA